ncbi:hypothetical protein Avbf_14267 [Armadillidium vulgare]|nr:hypothetical protein Avbf_14267 [Armadillidium vulgare]
MKKNSSSSKSGGREAEILDKIRDPQQQPAEITLEEIKDVFQSPNKDDEFNLNISTIIRNSFPSQIKKNYNKYLPVLFGGGPSEDDDGRSQNVYDVNVTEARARRLKRQSGFLGLSIPTLEPIYRGPDEKDDICERDEILHVDGECYHILSQGPSGRILFTSSFGSPVCGCPYGTYEEEPDLDEDVCQPVLGKLESCEPGEVYWFRSFRAEPECLPDPCKGLNAKKGLNELPYVPSIFDNKCYQLGQELIQCPDDTFYTLSYSSLHGICASLEDAGYTVLDEEMLEAFARMYGSRLPRDKSPMSLSSSFSSSFSSSSSSSNKRHDFPDIGSSAVNPSFNSKSGNIQLKIGQSVLLDGSSSDDESSSSSSSSSPSKSFSKA